MGVVLRGENGVRSNDDQVEGNEDDTNPLAEVEDPLDSEKAKDSDECDEEDGHFQ